MSTTENKFLSIYRKLFYGLFLVLAFGLIYILFPKQGTFKYEFQKGKPWSHVTLIAPYDFPVLKPKDFYEAEKDSLIQQYIPYFKVDPDVELHQLSELEHDVRLAFGEHESQIDTLIRNQTLKTLSDLYRQVYLRGVLENSIDSYDAMQGKSALYKIENNRAEIVSDTTVLSLKSAYQLVNEEVKLLTKSDTVILSIQKFIDISEYISPNLTYDDTINIAQTKELVKTISTTKGVVQEGVRIISEGDVVSGEKYLELESLKLAFEQHRSYGGWLSVATIGQMLLIIMLLSMLVLYLQNFNPKIFWKKRNFMLIITTVVATVSLARLIYDSNSVSIYLLPVCILPIIIRTFLGARMAIYIHLISMLMIGFLAPNSFEYVFIQLVAGTVAVVSLSTLQRRGHLVITALLLMAVYSFMFVSFELVKEGTFSGIDWGELKWFAGNVFLLLIAYPLIYIFERIFGFVSDVTLMELSDTNHPLLRELAEVAPGTFQHVMQVANLSEEVVRRIGGNAMLVRTGALYHDVGKIKSAQYFIENQGGGENPHDQLSKLESAERIISHVHDGVVLARKHNIPESIIDFIKMHHGRSMARYFYLKYKEENPDATISEEQFTYPGPNPTTRETAIVMLADGVEAATRSLPEKNEESIRNMINQIIDAKLKNHELDDAPITFKDIKDIKAIFLEKLKNIYHLRIQYPKEKNESN